MARTSSKDSPSLPRTQPQRKPLSWEGGSKRGCLTPGKVLGEESKLKNSMDY